MTYDPISVGVHLLSSWFLSLATYLSRNTNAVGCLLIQGLHYITVLSFLFIVPEGKWTCFLQDIWRYLQIKRWFPGSRINI